MLVDLHLALRKRRTLSFFGFSFPHRQPVRESRPPIFCPASFTGFLVKAEKQVPPPSTVFFTRFHGFLNVTSIRKVSPLELVWLRRFRGFLETAEPVRFPSTSIFCSGGFEGFLHNAAQCVASATTAAR
jgi:hypothetical protein